MGRNATTITAIITMVIAAIQTILLLWYHFPSLREYRVADIIAFTTPVVLLILICQVAWLFKRIDRVEWDWHYYKKAYGDPRDAE